MTLAEEAQRYLAAVEAFRAEGCEPHWRPEQPPPPVDQPSTTGSRTNAKDDTLSRLLEGEIP